MTRDSTKRERTEAGKRRSVGAAILARTLADRRVLIRKLVIGEAVGERPGRGLALRIPPTGTGAKADRE